MSDLLSLCSDDDLTAVLLSTDTTGLGRCMSVCRRLHQMLSTPQLLRMLAIEHGFRARTVSNEDDDDLGTQFELTAAHVISIEALAVLEKMRRVETNHIIFRLGSLDMTPSSAELLGRYADLMRQHPRLLLRLDSHTGVGAPPMIHRSHSVRRASVVAEYLDDRGVSLERISVNAWGYRVGMKRNWPARPEFARVELFVAFAPKASCNATADDNAVPSDIPAASGFDRSACLPAWPSYYAEVNPVRSEIQFDHHDENFDFDAIDTEIGDDGDADHEHNGVPLALLPLLLQLQGLQGLGPNDTVTLANGQVVDAVALLHLLQGINGGPGHDSDDDDDLDLDD